MEIYFIMILMYLYVKVLFLSYAYLNMFEGKKKTLKLSTIFLMNLFLNYYSIDYDNEKNKISELYLLDINGIK